jgi:internalin A
MLVVFLFATFLPATGHAAAQRYERTDAQEAGERGAIEEHRTNNVQADEERSNQPMMETQEVAAPIKAATDEDESGGKFARLRADNERNKARTKRTTKTQGREEQLLADEVATKPIAQWFPDAILAEVIAKSLNLSDVNVRIGPTELARIIVLRYDGLSKAKIKSLEGLQYAPNLQYALFNDNEIEDLQPLSHLTKIVELSFFLNKVSNLAPLRQLVNIRRLTLSGNKIRDVQPLSMLHNLKYLQLNNNEITEVEPLRTLTSLEELNLSVNQVADLSPLSPLLHLHLLNVANNHITDITPLASLKELRQLNIGKTSDANNNNIADFGVLTVLPNLTRLNLDRQGIARIARAVLHQLEELSVQNSNLDDITPFVGLSKLTKLDLDGNNISDLSPLSGASFPDLKYIGLISNKISDLRPLQTVSLPQLEHCWVYAQKIELELWYQPNITVENVVYNEKGDLVPPNVVLPSGKGVYESPNLIWQIEQPLYKENVSYRWETESSVGTASGLFSGTYEITVLAHYPVQFIVDGNVFHTLDVLPATFIQAPADDPVKIGHRFTGWYTAPNAGYKWNFEQSRVSFKELFLYARFQRLSYTVTFDGIHQSGLYFFEQPLRAPRDPTKYGHTFIGWFSAREGGRQWNFAKDTMPAHDLTLYPRYEVNTYTITFEDDTGKQEKVSVDFDTLLVPPREPTKAGYTFIGWYIGQAGVRKWDFAKDTMPANDMTLYARYEINTYTVIFKYDDGSIESVRVVYGDAISERKISNRPGFIFTGWYTAMSGGSAWDFARDTVPAGDLTLYARWEAVYVHPSWTMHYANVSLTPQELISLQRQNKLAITLLERANIQIVDGTGASIYNPQTASFVIANMAELQAITGIGVYDVHIIYDGPKVLFATAPLTVSIKLVIAHSDASGGEATDDKMNENERQTDTRAPNDGQLIPTGTYHNEQLLMGLALIGASLVVFIRRYSRKA